jgi:hypothetical protein
VVCGEGISAANYWYRQGLQSVQLVTSYYYDVWLLEGCWMSTQVLGCWMLVDCLVDRTRVILRRAVQGSAPSAGVALVPRRTPDGRSRYIPSYLIRHSLSFFP